MCLVNHQGNATHTLWQYKLSHLTPAIELNWKIKRIEIWQVPLIKRILKNFLMKNCMRLLETNYKPPEHYPGYQRFFLACVGELRFFGRRLTLLRLDRNRKPRMKSLWHPGYQSATAFQKKKKKNSINSINPLLLRGLFYIIRSF